ncbi:nuclear transport factor 2 family protein [Saccharopolyspora pogona]|uniref:nuclear transport factor 2 family protein n=1 Tax=Saccharopolyspora pogona TaxID=333966 RepID=UPI0016828596|nr:nuclear transport factor 2 family protein [Saccharopolyspora pogona]
MRVDLRGSRDDLSLEERIARIEDTLAIRTLWAHYAHLADTEDSGDSISELHTETAVWEAHGPGNFGRYEGRAAIRSFFENLYAVSPFRHHAMTNDYLDLSDDRVRATGRWKLTDLCTMAAGEPAAVLLLGDYEAEFAKVDGVWCIDAVHLRSTAWSDWSQGWVAQPDRDAE